MSNKIDEQVKKILIENPLMGFSVYSHTQVETLQLLGKEVLDIMDNAITEGCIEGKFIQKVYGLFWLWILGAYEVIRTMTQANICFSEQFSVNLQTLKKQIALLRIPFAKQEYPGKNTPIANEASIYSVDTVKKDIKYEVKENILSTRELINEFESLFSTMTYKDVLYDHRESYKK